LKKNLKLEYYPILNRDLLDEAINKIKNNRNKWEEPFFFDTKSNLDINQITRTIKPYLSEKIKNIIVLGTGGSIQTLLAIKHLSKKKIFAITSSRAVELYRCLTDTTPEDSIVIPISRGGETLDVNSTIGTFLKEGYNFLGLSSAGTMNEILQKIECPIMEVPDLSGRFAGSVTNVGIVPACIAGIKIEDFLRGLEVGYENFSSYKNNKAIEFSAYLYNLYKKNYKAIFSMPYSKNLEGSVGLWVQGISESTGKDEKGMIGTYQEAPLCQHSVLEYLLGGMKGVVIPILWSIENDKPDLDLSSSLEYVNRRSAQTIVSFQADATFQALIQQGVPSAMVSLNSPSEESIGFLIAFILSSVYYFCVLIDTNWATNPKVIIGKQICNNALKEDISTKKRREIRKEIAKEKFKNFF
jgi:glucose-6-phosphate isomerase